MDLLINQKSAQDVKVILFMMTPLMPIFVLIAMNGKKKNAVIHIAISAYKDQIILYQQQQGFENVVAKYFFQILTSYTMFDYSS